MSSRGFLVLDAVTRLAVLAAVRDFDAFGSANAPWGEHDCAVVDAGAALTQGIEVPRLPRVLERTLEVLREDYDCDIALDLPYADRRRIGLAEVREDFAATLMRPGVAYLVVLWGVSTIGASCAA